MRFGLTGARGVLGSRVAASLRRLGHEVCPFNGDVRDPRLTEPWPQDLDVVIHAAAMVAVRDVEATPHDAIATNVLGTANIARAVSGARGCRLVYISSSHVYAPSDQPLSEQAPLEPTSAYGLTKLQGEAWATYFVPDSLIARVFSFFDVHQNSPYLVPSLYDRIISAPVGGELPLRGASNIRDMSDAVYLGEVIARLSVSQEGGIVNCGSGRGASISELSEAMSLALERPDVRWTFEQDSAPNGMVADVQKMSTRLGDIPPFDLSLSLRDFVATRRRLAQLGADVPRS